MYQRDGLLGALVTSFALAAPAVVSGCATHRVYDPAYSDYHVWTVRKWSFTSGGKVTPIESIRTSTNGPPMNKRCTGLGAIPRLMAATTASSSHSAGRQA